MKPTRFPDFSERLQQYTGQFLQEDVELYPQEISNPEAYSWMLREIPFLDCPDKDLERTYYYRWWTLRKHWKTTPYGHILTEFLPPVSWSGPYNSINCAAGHHIREARWMKDENNWIPEYIQFWLTGPGDALSYSMWFADSVKEYLNLHPDPSLLEKWLDPLDRLYREREEKSLHSSGLFWSEDDRDGMEFSISGSGLRPTLNSYMYGDAAAIAELADAAGRFDLAERYRKRAEHLKKAIDLLLWDGEFYKTIPCSPDSTSPDNFITGRCKSGISAQTSADPTEFRCPEADSAHNARELIGYIPWYFHIPDPDKDAAFRHLFDPEGFAAAWGLTTAEQRHPRFLFSHPHECLWNGYVWPFATSQTLTAMANAIRDRQSSQNRTRKYKPDHRMYENQQHGPNRNQAQQHGPNADHCPIPDRENPLTSDNFYFLLRQYALSHQITGADGRSRSWIDESMHPYTGRWYTRDLLCASGWKPEFGGLERGKDYNHSTFCDLVLSGLLGISLQKDGTLQADPLLPSHWDYFMVSNLTSQNRTICYDRDGTHYGMGAGLQII